MRHLQRILGPHPARRTVFLTRVIAQLLLPTQISAGDDQSPCPATVTPCGNVDHVHITGPKRKSAYLSWDMVMHHTARVSTKHQTTNLCSSEAGATSISEAYIFPVRMARGALRRGDENLRCGVPAVSLSKAVGDDAYRWTFLSHTQSDLSRKSNRKRNHTLAPFSFQSEQVEWLCNHTFNSAELVIRINSVWGIALMVAASMSFCF